MFLLSASLGTVGPGQKYENLPIVVELSNRRSFQHRLKLTIDKLFWQMHFNVGPSFHVRVYVQANLDLFLFAGR